MKQIIIIVSLIGIYLSFTSCRPADNRQADYDFTPLDSIITSWMNKGYYPGASICVVRDDSVIFQKNYKDVTPDTKVYVASAGKWVAAAVIGAVVDCTELDWNDSVKKWIPEFKNDIKGMITLRQLLSHTSGVRPYLPEPRVDNYNHLDSAVITPVTVPLSSMPRYNDPFFRYWPTPPRCPRAHRQSEVGMPRL